MVELNKRSSDKPMTILHGLDSRLKLMGLVALSVAVLNARLTILASFIVLLVGLIYLVTRKRRFPLKQSRPVLILLAMVFAVRVWVTPGPPIWTLGFLSVSMAGLSEGALVSGRLLAIFLLGWLLMFTTRSTEIKAGVQWFFAPIPFIPEKRVATMMGLIMRFIPVIYSQFQATTEAQLARGIANRKNPVTRMTRLILPLMRRTFETADKLAVAMTARCYAEDRTDPHLEFSRRDGITALIIVTLCIVIAAG